MTQININRKITDPFYRYKMPQMILKIEGNGNGIKTVISNLSDVSKSLGTNPEYLIKFFGSELGSQPIIYKDEDKYILKGVHSLSALDPILDIYIKKLILCLVCQNPETILYVRNKHIYSICKACGNYTRLTINHKIESYIIKNPPSKEKAISLLDKISILETKKEIKQNISMEISNKPQSKKERLDKFNNFVKENKDSLCINEVLQLASDLRIKERSICVLVEHILPNLTKENIKYILSIFKKFVKNDKEEKMLLYSLEVLVTQIEPSMISKLNYMLQTFYLHDILSEDICIKWYNDISSKFVTVEEHNMVKKETQVFIKWLQEAEESSTDESEPELEPKSIKSEPDSGSDFDSDSDINIDAI